MQAWTRTAHGLVHVVDTDPQLHGAITALVMDCHPKPATTSETSYQSDKASLEGSYSSLKMVVSDNHIPLTAANPGR
jgi:hypothetical protein